MGRAGRGLGKGRSSRWACGGTREVARAGALSTREGGDGPEGQDVRGCRG